MKEFFLPRRQISHEVDSSEIKLFNKIFLNAYLPEVFVAFLLPREIKIGRVKKFEMTNFEIISN